MDTAIIVAIIAAVSSSGVSSLLIYLLQRRDKRKDQETDREKAKTQILVGLARECIVDRCKYHLESGITYDEWRDLEEHLYKPYRALGGNGTAERLMKDVSSLQFIVKREEKEDKEES